MQITRRNLLKSAAVVGFMTTPLPELCAQTLPTTKSTDRRTGPDYLEHSIREISDENLFAAIDLSAPQLAKVKAAVDRRDFPAAYLAWADYWNAVAPTRVQFPGVGDLIMPRDEAIQSFQPQKDQILAAAEPILAHKINGWGTVTIQHGPVVDFNADYGVNGKYGFHYWGWSRRLTEAYLVTHDEKYLAAFDELFNQWYAQRNSITDSLKYLHVVYNELGLGLRCRPFIEYYSLPFSARSSATHEHMLKTLLGTARWLYEEENRQYRNGNWQIMGSYGLAYIGLMLPEFREASAWVKLAQDRLTAHVEADFFSDGCHSERVPSSYMLVAYRDPRNLAMLLHDRLEYAEISERIRKPLERTLNWYLYALRPMR